MLARGPKRLLVLDEIWTDEQLAAFPLVGQTARLFTTRNPSLAGGTAITVTWKSARTLPLTLATQAT